MSRTAVILLLSAVLMAPVLATAEKTGKTKGDRKPSEQQLAAPANANPNSAAPDTDTLGYAVRKAGESPSTSVVLMLGIENIRLENPAEGVRGHAAEQVAQSLASAGRCQIQTLPGYSFLYVPGYEQLAALSLEGQLPAKYRQIKGAMSFGAGMPLYTALAWISQALNVSLVADDAVGDSKCGEIALGTVSVQDALEALLKSARVVSFAVDATDEYVFVHAKANASPVSALLNETTLDAASKALLDKRVDVYLPQRAKDPARFPLRFSATPLNGVLASLSDQVGASVTATSEMGILPVNPMTLRGVRVRTALDLVVRQWLAPEFGYEVIDGKITLRQRVDSERIAASQAMPPAQTR